MEMLDDIIENAQNGDGPCEGCPAYLDSEGEYVNPGLLNPDANVMFLTLDPSHHIDWSRYESWEDHNREYADRFASWRGGKKIAEIVEPLGLTPGNVWLGDTIKCPVDNSLRRFENRAAIERAFDHCSAYLIREVEWVDPNVIVTFGEETATRLLTTVFDVHVSGLKPGTRDCGKIYRTEPPVVISPHWSHGWLDRSPNGHRNVEIVKEALVEAYPD